MAAIVLKVSVEGLRELDRALAELPKATARNTLHRVLKRAAQPIADAMAANAPVDTGKLKASIAISTKIRNTMGSAEYAEAMRQGLGKAAASSALRAARRANPSQKSFAEVYVGPAKGGAHGRLQEFGTVHHKPQPFARPAWDQEQDNALAIITRDLGDEIMKSAARVAKNAARKAAKAKG